MRKLLLSSVAVAAIAVAATGPAKAIPPSYSWTGCYVGGNIGGGWANKNFLPDFTTDGAGPAHMSSVVGGTQLGCDVQNGAWVFGLQGMFDWASMSGDSPFIIGKGYTTRIPWFATATGRVGYLAQPSVLIFVRGGVAFVRDEHKYMDGAFVAEIANVTRNGLTLGGGIDWMFAPNWSVTVEYGYMGFGTKVVDFQGVGFFPSFSNRVDQHMQVVLVSVNYRFGSWGGR